MYLNYFEENEKIAFLKIAHIIALSDGQFCENEKIIIGSYCNELGMKNIELNVEHESLNLLSNEFNTKQSQKIVILELMSIIDANGEFKKSEKEIINQLTKNFDIEDTFIDDVRLWSKSLMHIIGQGADLIQDN